MPDDPRLIEHGHPIPSEGYADQPYVVVNADGSWTVLLTTCTGHEGDTGQHIVASRSTDAGRTWSPLVDIEPARGPEASWVVPLLTPGGRLYAFYTYNHENRREIKADDPPFKGGVCRRVDSFGAYACKYSDDGGRTWSAQRWELPVRAFAIDRENAYGGTVRFFWGVGKPFIHAGKVYLFASKVGGFGKGFFTRSEGMLLVSDNLLTEADPAKHRWETRPDGEIGLRGPGGPIAEEHNGVALSDGSLFCTYRTVDGFSCHAYSRDAGHTWTAPAYMTEGPGGRRIKNPRAANFVRRCANGKFIYWSHHHGGEVLGRAPQDGWQPYDSRNPAWLRGGVERDGVIHWSQPEIVLYDDAPGTRMSYPDFFEAGGRYYFTETQKTIARVHEFDAMQLAGLWADAAARADADAGARASRPLAPPPAVARAGLLGEWRGATLAAAARVQMPSLPALHDRGGCTLELRVRFTDLTPWQVLFDARDAEGKGLLLQLTDRGTLKLSVAGRVFGSPGGRWACGLTESAWACDAGVLAADRWHQIAFIVDGGPKLISVVVDGVLGDGGTERQFGWGRCHPGLKDANGAATAIMAPSLRGELAVVRLYGRSLRTCEAVANWRADSAG